MPPTSAVLDRFWAKVKPAAPDECWEWQATKTAGGYGRFNARGVFWMAHRFAYVTMVGEIPEGLELDHLCRNRACVNPAHLEPVTRRENIRRGVNFMADRMQADRCQRGHAFTPENTKIRHGCRLCRECLLATQRRCQARYRAKARAS